MVDLIRTKSTLEVTIATSYYNKDGYFQKHCTLTGSWL